MSFNRNSGIKCRNSCVKIGLDRIQCGTRNRKHRRVVAKPAACAPNAVNTRAQGKEGGMKGGTVERGREEGRGRKGRETGRELSLIHI